MTKAFRGLLLAVLGLSACAEQASLPVAAGYGPQPRLPPPEQWPIPTINVAPAEPWPDGATPTAAAGLRVVEFADGLDHPRWLYVLPGGDVLVAETNAPPKPEDNQGIKGWVMGLFMEQAGAAVPSANRITLLRDADGDGSVDQRSVFLENLNSPFGMALVGNDFYVADTDALLRFPYQPGQTRIDAPGEKVVGPAGRSAQPSLDQERDREPRWRQALRDGRLEQRHRRERHGCGGRPRRDLGGRPPNRRAPDLRLRPAQPERPRLGAPERDAVDHRQRARRARQRPRPRLHDLRPGRRLLRLALQLLRRPPRPAGRAAAARSGRQGDRAGLRAWARTRPRSGSRSRTAPRRCRRRSGRAPSSVSTAPGTAGRPAATRWSSCRSGTAARRRSVRRADRLPRADDQARGRPVGVAIDRQGALLVADDVGNRVWRVATAAEEQTAAR